MTVKYKRFIWTALVMVMAVTVTACSNKTESDETSKKVSEEEQAGIELPYELDDGRMVLNSIFQSSISNPDCNDENGENTASIEVINQSGQFLASADVEVTLEGGTTLNFKIEDIPAGGTVWAFEIDNIGIDENYVCKSVSCAAEYEDDMPVMAESISFEAEGTTVTIQNLTDGQLSGLEAGFHCLFDEGVYYGGQTYTYPIDTIPAGESISLEVPECYLGTAEAVRVTQEGEQG